MLLLMILGNLYLFTTYFKDFILLLLFARSFNQLAMLVDFFFTFIFIFFCFLNYARSFFYFGFGVPSASSTASLVDLFSMISAISVISAVQFLSCFNLAGISTALLVMYRVVLVLSGLGDKQSQSVSHSASQSVSKKCGL